MKCGVCPEQKAPVPSRWPHFLSSLSCLLRMQRVWEGSAPGSRECAASGSAHGGGVAGLTNLSLPGGHPPALLHALHYAVDRSDRQEHLQAGDQEGSTVPQPRPASRPQAAPAQVPKPHLHGPSATGLRVACPGPPSRAQMAGCRLWCSGWGARGRQGGMEEGGCNGQSWWVWGGQCVRRVLARHVSPAVSYRREAPCTPSGWPWES